MRDPWGSPPVPESGFTGILGASGGTPPLVRHGAGVRASCVESGAFRGQAWSPTGSRSGWHLSGSEAVGWHGDIVNSRAIAAELGLPESTPLPLLLLAAWRRWSVDCLARIDGVFALAMHRPGRLLLYRDPSGLASLYVHQHGAGRLAFASDLATLIAQPGVPRRLDRRSLHEYLRLLDIAAPNTLFEGVKAVEPGQALLCTKSSTRSLVPAARAPAPPSGFDAAVDELDARLRAAVQGALAGSKRPAAFLSGGVDSALICALAARVRPDTTAITVGFDSAVHDEAAAAARVAKHLGLAHQVLRFSRADCVAAFERLAASLEQPMADPSTPVTVLAFDHCRDAFDAVLDGTGADEIVGALPPRHVRVAVGVASRFPRPLRLLARGLLGAIAPLARYTPIVDFEHPAETTLRWHGFGRTEIEALCGEPVSFAHTRYFRTFERFPRHAHFERHTALINAMPCERLNQAMRASALDVRFPFWNPEVIGCIRELRTEFRSLPNEPKRILRALLARYVPRALWDQPKHGFDFPLQEFLTADNHSLVRHYLDPERWQHLGWISAAGIQRYARRFVEGDRSLAFRIWSLVVLGAWLEKHDELH